MTHVRVQCDVVSGGQSVESGGGPLTLETQGSRIVYGLGNVLELFTEVRLLTNLPTYLPVFLLHFRTTG